jgi:anti-sigma-K factor RskA
MDANSDAPDSPPAASLRPGAGADEGEHLAWTTELARIETDLTALRREVTGAIVVLRETASRQIEQSAVTAGLSAQLGELREDVGRLLAELAANAAGDQATLARVASTSLRVRQQATAVEQLRGLATWGNFWRSIAVTLAAAVPHLIKWLAGG